MLKSIVFDVCLYLSLMKIWLSRIADHSKVHSISYSLSSRVALSPSASSSASHSLSKLVCFPARMFIISFLPLSPSWCGRLSLQSIYNASNFTLSLSEHALNYIAGKFTHFHKHTQNMTGIENFSTRQSNWLPEVRGLTLVCRTWTQIPQGRISRM